MGPWTIFAALGNQATLALYAGAPDQPDHSRVWQWVDRHSVSVLGVSPTLIRALQAAGEQPVQATSRRSLRVFGSTGEPWTPSPWQWLHEVVGERRRPIVNVSGGTEAGILVAVQPLLGVKPVSVGGPTLGKAVIVLGADATPLGPGELGELAVTAPWPGMTRGFWREGPELSLIHISEPTRLGMISYAVFCLKKKKNKKDQTRETVHKKRKTKRKVVKKNQ